MIVDQIDVGDHRCAVKGFPLHVTLQLPTMLTEVVAPCRIYPVALGVYQRGNAVVVVRIMRNKLQGQSLANVHVSECKGLLARAYKVGITEIYSCGCTDNCGIQVSYTRTCDAGGVASHEGACGSPRSYYRDSSP